MHQGEKKKRKGGQLKKVNVGSVGRAQMGGMSFWDNQTMWGLL